MPESQTDFCSGVDVQTIEERLECSSASCGLKSLNVNSSFIKRWKNNASRGDDTLFNQLLKSRNINVKISRENTHCLWRSQTPIHRLDYDEKAGSQCYRQCAIIQQSHKRLAKSSAIEDIWYSYADQAWEVVENQLSRHRHAAWTKSLITDIKKTLVRSIQDCFSELIGGSTCLPGNESAHTQWDQLTRIYPVTQRLLHTVISQWVSNTSLLLSRWLNDLPTIERTFFPATKSRLILTGIRCEAGDSHNGGQRVCILQLNDNRLLVYKPRDLGADVAWGALLQWLQSHGLEHSLTAPKVLSAKAEHTKSYAQKHYGWVEFLDDESEKNAQDWDAASYNYGVLLCLSWIFGLNDLHHENVIVRNNAAVPLDIETLLNPTFTNKYEQLSTVLTFRLFRDRQRDTVLTTGLLPRWELDNRGRVVDASGLSKMQQVNMSRLMAGFRVSAQFLQARGCDLLDDDLLIQELRTVKSRVIIRNSAMYDYLRKLGLQPENLRDGMQWSLPWEVLHRFGSSRDCNNICQLEKMALARLDIPIFHALADSCDLYVGSEVCSQNFFEQSGVELLSQRLARLSDSSIEEQLKLCRLSLHHLQGKDHSRRRIFSHSLTRGEESGFLSADYLMSQCFAIADELQNSACYCGNGVTWMAMTPVANSSRYRIDGLDYGLYQGNLGIALYLAALAQVSGQERYRYLAHRALAPVRELAADRLLIRRELGNIGIGIASGLGGIFYGLAKISQWQPENETITAIGRVLLDEFEQKLVDRDRRFDLMNGSAGAILGLLAWHSATADQDALAIARQCADHLMANQSSQNNTLGGWLSKSGDALCGMSHGSAGVIMALARLRARLGKKSAPNLDASVSLGLQFEQAHFDAETNNWLDLRQGKNTSAGVEHSSQWCHGAPGIGLARLGIQFDADSNPHGDISDGKTSRQIRQDLQRAIVNCRSQPLKSVDHVCCGNLGIIDFLRDAGLKTRQQKLVELANTRLITILERASRKGSFSFASGSNSENPGFFLGSAGIGYCLLRHVASDLPAVTRFE